MRFRFKSEWSHQNLRKEQNVYDHKLIMKTIIRSSSHSLKFANIGKQSKLKEFLIEYNKVKWELVDYFWNNKITWNNKILDIKNNQLECPTFISTINLPIKTNLSSRAIKLASGEALSIISGAISKRNKQLYVLAQKQRSGEILSIKKLQSKIDSTPLVKPTNKLDSLFVKLDSNCCTYISTKNNFGGFLKIYSIGKIYGHIYIPIKLTKHSNKFRNDNFKIMTSWNISERQVYSIWKKEITPSIGTKIVGADQGITTTLSLSDGQTTKKNKDGHDFTSIIKILNRKQKGSKAFKRTQEHRTNYINWSINQLNLIDVKEIRLERLFQMRKGQNIGKFISNWTYTQINTQIKSRCDLLGVQVIEQPASYRSQRCNNCGWVLKINRQGKEFICRKCNHIADSDINGALNHEVDLYQLPFNFRQMKLNKFGFYWLETGIFDSLGQAITVPDEYKNNYGNKIL